MKKVFKNLTALLLICILGVTPVISTNGAGSAIEKLYNEGIIQGYEDGELHGEYYLTRGEFAALLCKTFTDVAFTEVYYEFTDLEKGHWAQEYIQKSVNAGWLKGYEDNTIRADEYVTYEEALTVICRVLGLDNRFCSYPEDYISTSIEYNLTTGADALIGEWVTREDVGEMICNSLEYLALIQESGFAEAIFSKASSGGGSSGWNVVSAPTDGAVYLMEDCDSYEEVEEVFVPYNTEEYSINQENVFKNVLTSPLSAFSIDTDTASYSNMRRFILNGQNIPQGSIRSEELVNYFDYIKAAPDKGKPFGVGYSVDVCPWNKEHKLAMITVSGEELTEFKASNLVFLVDTSGSMSSYNKLPLVKQALAMLLDKLGENDRISIVTYASGTSIALEPTPATEKELILNTLNSLNAAGATAGADGINLAYEQAEKFKIADGNNRIILCTDGDFNIGKASDSELETLITQKRESGIYLSVLGFGMGNYKDAKMEILADKGNGNYAYIDNLREAKKVLVDEMSKTIYTIAKDVKMQVEFNPEKVAKYRFVGYENRLLNNEDFENDMKDAGELGSGATVTVLYEIIPSGQMMEDPLMYSKVKTTGNDELMFIKIRHKEPNGTDSILNEYVIYDEVNNQLKEDFNFAAAVAELGMLLNDSEHKGTATLDSVLSLAREGLGEDKFGLRHEFIQLVDLFRYRSEK